MARIVLAMSGGVDSSVAAHMLCAQGHEVIGVFMRHGVAEPKCDIKQSSQIANDGSRMAEDARPQTPLELPIVVAGGERLDHKQGCCTARDAADASRVADRLGIPFYALNLDDDFARIVDYFVDEYLIGRTPNPCVMCNNWIKFGKLFDYAASVEAEFVATGHYARIERDASNQPMMLRGVDSDKDQSYVLFGVRRQDLPRMMLPLGGYQKSEIRRMATDWNVLVADKKDSQEICFVTVGHHAEFVRSRAAGRSRGGEFVTTDGRHVGTHDGIERFTIGQRKGLGVALGEPYFVVRIEAEEGRVVLGRREELGTRSLVAHRLNWIADLPGDSFRCYVQIRYNSRPQLGRVTLIEQGKRFTVDFDQPCEGVAPGQAVVCYDEQRVLGGGWIATTTPYHDVRGAE